MKQRTGEGTISIRDAHYGDVEQIKAWHEAGVEDAVQYAAENGETSLPEWCMASPRFHCGICDKGKDVGELRAIRTVEGRHSHICRTCYAELLGPPSIVKKLFP